ncbi:MAG: hypothetical protein ACW968_01265 [Candidatus Thorarchaeota archaeon]|jgi:hypothetical protein
MSILPFDPLEVLANLVACSDYFYTRVMYYMSKGSDVFDAVPKAIVDAGARFIAEGVEEFLKNLGHFLLEQWKKMQQS